MSTMTPQRGSLWEVSARTVVYAAIGAALYAVFAQFSFILPGTQSVSIRPAFVFVTFFGFAFGPIVGLFTGAVGNALADQISGWGLLTSWDWSLAAGAVGLLAGLVPSIWSGAKAGNARLIAAAVGSAVAVLIGYVIVILDIPLGTTADFNAFLTANYIPVVVANVLTVVILMPILVTAWEPISERMGR